LFEKLDTAKYILEVFYRINDQMDQAIVAIEKGTPPDEFKNFKIGVGHVLSEVFEKIIEPICERHPSLRPPEMEG